MNGGRFFKDDDLNLRQAYLFFLAMFPAKDMAVIVLFNHYLKQHTLHE
jgi:hypothetical protein